MHLSIVLSAATVDSKLHCLQMSFYVRESAPRDVATIRLKIVSGTIAIVLLHAQLVHQMQTAAQQEGNADTWGGVSGKCNVHQVRLVAANNILRWGTGIEERWVW